MLITTKQDNMKKSPYEQAGMIDPMLTNAQGMPVDPMQSIDPMQPVNVGMPGSTPVPAGVAQNMQQPVQAGQRTLNPIAPMAMKGDLDKNGKMSSYEQARQTAIEKNMALQQNGKVEKVDAVTGGIQKSNEGPIVRTKGAGRENPYARHTAFDGSAIKLPSVQQQVDKYDKQVTDQKTKKRLIKAVKSTK